MSRVAVGHFQRSDCKPRVNPHPTSGKGLDSDCEARSLMDVAHANRYRVI
jgi:hypothetical protein